MNSERIRKASKTSSAISFQVSPEARRLLGKKGARVLDDVQGLIKLAARDNNWPLAGIEARVESDPEFENNEYALVILKLHSKNGGADEILNDLYSRLQDFANGLDGDEREVFMGKIYFDVETL